MSQIIKKTHFPTRLQSLKPCQQYPSDTYFERTHQALLKKSKKDKKIANYNPNHLLPQSSRLLFWLMMINISNLQSGQNINKYICNDFSLIVSVSKPKKVFGRVGTPRIRLKFYSNKVYKEKSATNGTIYSCKLHKPGGIHSFHNIHIHNKTFITIYFITEFS